MASTKVWGTMLVAAVAAYAGAIAAPVHAAELSKSRKFQFHYSCAVSELQPGARADVWVPIAQSGADQSVEVQRIEVPGDYKIETEPEYGNKILHFQAKANEQGQIPIAIDYLVERREITPANGEATDPEQLKRFLAADALVPTDGKLVEQLLGAKPEGPVTQVAHQIYDSVENRMKYDKTGEGWGRGDTLWAVESCRGNCTDFHSVFISLCRSLDIPGKFEIGFSVPTDKQEGEIAGYHCWAKYADGGHWIGVDISEADKNPALRDYYFGNLTADRVMFSVGRDLTLTPKQQGEPVNFLIYPYAEVDGKPHAKLIKGFSFADVTAKE